MSVVRRNKSSDTTKIADSVAEDVHTARPLDVEQIDWISTGCPTLNLALSGNVRNGFPIGRVTNGIGTRDTGKTLLACEVVNQAYYVDHKKLGKSLYVAYNEPENKFDYQLAANNGLPVDFIHWDHTKDSDSWYNWAVNCLNQNVGKYDIMIMVTDSLDGILSKREQKHANKKNSVGAQDYKVGVPSMLSYFFKENSGLIKECNCVFYIISQVRANIGAKPWERKLTRSAGHALDHYATIIYWLEERGNIEHENGMAQGKNINVEVEKNHAAVPSMPVDFRILYGYGLDHIGSSIEFATKHEILVPSGSWYSWGGEKFQGKANLEPFFEENEAAYQALLEAIQHKWDAMRAEAQIKRKPKWQR